MFTRHFEFWPKHLPKSLPIPESTIYDNLETTTKRYPNKTAIVFYGTEITYEQLHKEVEQLAGYLQQELEVSKGDRVLLYMQNSPQYIIAFYAILRVGAVVVPINPMNVKDEVAFYLSDCDAKVAIAGQELMPEIEPCLGVTPLQHIVVAAYSEYAQQELDYEVPPVVTEEKLIFISSAITGWKEALLAGHKAGPSGGTSDDLCCLPYTSGTTGKPKGCMHTHKTLQATLVGGAVWGGATPADTSLSTLPLYHVTGMQHNMNGPIYLGGTMVVMTRWDRDVALTLMERYRVTRWTNISTMVVDFLGNQNLKKEAIESLRMIGGGGAPLPEAVGQKLFELTGLRYVEGYGLTETMSQIHQNPLDRAKLQCLGVPQFDVDARVVDPVTLKELGPHEEGEIIVTGEQVFKGYWNRPVETKGAFVTIDGKEFFRTGDIARYDEEGYFFLVDRVKRMINASGFKVWPAEVEMSLYKHPSVQNACVIGVPDARRGETVKAFIVLNDSGKDTSAEEIITWAKEHMAAYKVPKIIQFLDALPVSGSGKILWRKLQEQEQQKVEG
ncbi:long-chain fatty acid--CoA ligase [Alkalihalobacterium chitinilyticum]|uniref:Long-chain fatty acid--CoA ligase n=1 Tax=Alkalihalobacterium chitinilyticum TaxID=2980103 RepID=A0ABT5VI98_9BACI|nr:long-chain fatty acid--CoA ligase [Alkalihalobacterium chitinilyticum]MDE5415175.1 long-chain fatty acid--CoA ligase [Alkalihalobacterium chitinilyticum]